MYLRALATPTKCIVSRPRSSKLESESEHHPRLCLGLKKSLPFCSGSWESTCRVGQSSGAVRAKAKAEEQRARQGGWHDGPLAQRQGRLTVNLLRCCRQVWLDNRTRSLAASQGFGFIKPDDGGEAPETPNWFDACEELHRHGSMMTLPLRQDLFAHVSALADGDGSIQEGDKVTYDKDGIRLGNPT